MQLGRETYKRWLAVAGIALVTEALIGLVWIAVESRSPGSRIVSAPVARTSAVPSPLAAAGPSGRSRAAAAFYPPSHALVLFGGRTAFDYSVGRPGVSNETWTWDGRSWRLLHPVNSPPARYGAGLVYDSVNNVLVLYGGTDGLYCCVDTWTWDGSNWKQMSPATSPPQWPVATMAYDSVRKAALLYLAGTFCPPDCVSPNQTWSWDGSTWSQIVTSTTPDPSDGPTNGVLGGVLAFDATSGQTLYIGQSGTWTLEGATARSSSARTLTANRWVELSAGGTATRAGAIGGWVGFAVASADTHLVEFGAYSDTWVWNGSAWTVQNPAVAPPPRTGEALAYDSERRVVILFGGAGNGAQSTGMNDTWAWDGAVWKQVA